MRAFSLRSETLGGNSRASGGSRCVAGDHTLLLPRRPAELEANHLLRRTRRERRGSPCSGSRSLSRKGITLLQAMRTNAVGYESRDMQFVSAALSSYVRRRFA